MNQPHERLRDLRRVRQYREFTDEPPSAEEIDAIVDAARWSGSSRNEQPWRFLVIRDIETIRRIGEMGLPQTRALPTATAAIAIILPDDPSREVMRAYDDGRAAERMLIAASMLGLGGGITWIRKDVLPVGREILGLPDDLLVRTIVALGHPTDAGRQRRLATGQARLPRDQTVFEDRWPGARDRAPLDFGQFEALTFDCYGTLIDWEAGMLAHFRPVLERAAAPVPDDAILEAYGRHEAELERGPYRRYREVLGLAFAGACRDVDVEPTDDEVRDFSGSVGDWPAFPDSTPALTRLAERFRLGVITNCDDDLFAASNRRLGVTFDWIVPAEQVGAYKPDERNFRQALDRIGLPRERILHVAQSLYHDIGPARRLGLATAWIDRRRGRSGSGATPPATAQPDITAVDLASFADLALG